MKRFKTKKRITFFKWLLYLAITVVSFWLIFSYFVNKFDEKIDPEEYVKLLLAEGFNNQIDNYSFINPLDLTKPLTLIENGLGFQYNHVLKTDTATIEAISKTNEQSVEPTIYIYNTHDQEAYKVSETQPYNITPNVKFASYILQEKLDDLGLKAIVETNSIGDILTTYDWKYANSYDASRILLEKAKQKYPSLKYYIDIHRDSSNGDKTTLSLDNNDYAKVLFIVGLENTNYEANLNLANALSNSLNNSVSNISRGIYKKEGPGVNGVYNQDFSPNSMLLEIGGYENSIDSVAKTINILGDNLYKYIKGDANEKA